MTEDLNITSTVSVLELFIVFLGLIGWLAAAFNITAAFSDQRRIKRSGLNGSMRRTVNGNVREELLRVLKLGLFILIGVIYMGTPPSIRPSNTVTTMLAGVCILMIEVLISYGSLASYYDRLRLKEDWAKEEVARHRAWDGKTERRHTPNVCPYCQRALGDALGDAQDHMDAADSSMADAAGSVAEARSNVTDALEIMSRHDKGHNGEEEVDTSGGT